ncbi:transposase [Enterobacter cloacae]|uniref:transposase n=1 Tax=Enterobacter cloacae TaxID=550 RepID=UPI003969C43B
MGTPRFTPEFKEEAVRQITERGYSVAEVSGRLAVWASLHTASTSGYGLSNLITTSSMPGIYWKLKARS